MAIVKPRKSTPSQSRSKAARTRSVRAGNDKLSDYIKPMLATIHDRPFNDSDWIFEIKWDGYRAIAETGSHVRLYSRNGLSFLRLYPAVAAELEKVKEETIIDGEIVVLNEKGKPDFQKLQQYDHYPSLSIVYYVFDCISYQGKSITHLPLVERKKIARNVLPDSNIVKYSDHIEQDGVEFFSKIVEMDVEGILAKRASSPYQVGRRSRDWLKIKNHNTQEAVIAGFTAPRGSREHFGALILGIYKNKRLQYIGHTGTGFTSATLKEVYGKLKPLTQNTSPFDSKVPVNSPVTWVRPVYVCEVKFTEVTEEGIMRHPVFLGLRIDKAAKEANTMDQPLKEKQTKPASSKKKSNSANVTVDGHRLKITNHRKLYWPDEKITKADVIDYYYSIREYILPYLKDRPQSLRRNPNGIKDKGFFHKDAGHGTPDWVKTVSLEAETANRMIEYIVCNNAATVAYLNNLGCIELNPWNSRISTLDNPDYLVMDLDPSEENSFDQVVETAQALKEVLDRAGAPAYCKTSGATGLHIYIPMGAEHNYEEVRSFAELIATLAHQHLPDITTVERSLQKRKGRLYIDYLQNTKGQTLASVYSLRPRPGATVSAPLRWDEVKKGLHPSQFNLFNIRERLNKVGDLFSGVLTERINLRKCLKALGA